MRRSRVPNGAAVGIGCLVGLIVAILVELVCKRLGVAYPTLIGIASGALSGVGAWGLALFL